MTRLPSPFVFLLVVTGWSASHGMAQDRPRTAFIKTQVPSPDLQSFGRALDRVLLARATNLGVVETTGAPALELGDIRLMTGCLSDSAECFALFAEQLESAALLLPTLEQAGADYIVTLSFFDARDRSLRSATRRARPDAVEESLIDAVDGLLRELFDLPPPPPTPDLDPGRRPAPSSAPPPSGSAPSGSEPDSAGERWSPVGPAVGGVGAALLVGALGAGVAARRSEDEYHAAPTTTVQEVDEALALRDEAQRRARAANVLLGVGAAGVAAGVLLTIFLRRPADRSLSLAPSMGPDHVGLSIGGVL